MSLKLFIIFQKNYDNYNYDKVGNIISDGLKEFSYDEVYRLTNVTDSNTGTTLETYTYDNIGNRNTSNNANLELNLNYNTNILNQYTQTLQNESEETSYIYDNNGNLINDGNYKYIYDYKNRIVKVENLETNEIIKYKYDILGRRYEKITQEETINYIYSNDTKLKEITTQTIETTTEIPDETGTGTTAQTQEIIQITNRDYILGIGTDNFIGFEENETKYYFYKNHLGSVEGIIDENNEIITTYKYDTFGNLENYTGNIGFNDILYTSREYENDLNLYYLRARYYNPELGRFIERDPIDIADDVNLYAYVGNNGVMFVDPSGLKSKSVITENRSIGDYIIGGLYIAGEFALDSTLGIETAGALGEGEEINEYSFAEEIGISEENLEKGGYTLLAVTTAYTGYKLYKNIKTGKIVKVVIDKDKYPEAAEHIVEAQSKGKPSILTIDRAGATSNRKESLKGYPTKKGYDRDEYPPAMFKEGGEGASIKYISPSDNRGAGVSIKNQLRNSSNGDKIKIEIK